MSNNIEQLIEKFRHDKLSQEECLELICLLENNLEFKRKLEAEFYMEVSPLISEKIESSVVGLNSMSNHFGSWWRVAAILLIMFGFWNLFDGHHPNTPAPDKQLTKEKISPVKLIRIKNNSTGDQKVTLADGSVVMLGKEAEINYSENFGQHERKINLTGRAIFKVASDTLRPFTVHARGLATTAVGTEFEVNTNFKDRVQVRLFEGRVKLLSDSLINAQEVFLNPGENAIYRLENFRINKKDFSDNNNNKYKKIKTEKRRIAPLLQLEYINEPLQHVLRDLSDTRKVKISYDTLKVQKLIFTGSILPTDQIDQILSLIGGMYGIEVHKTEPDTYILK